MILCGASLGFVKSRGVSPIPSPSSIGFTVVKNTACLPLLRLFPPGINPFLIVEFHSLAVPDVVDVLGKSFRYQYIVLQLRINSIIS